MKLVSVIILNYNKKDYLLRCLKTILVQSYKAIEIIVVDNGSSDGSQETLKKLYTGIKLIENEANYFTCKAVNQGIKASRGEYILYIHNDVELRNNFIAEMVKAAESDESIGMVSGRILFDDKKTIYSVGIFPAKSRRATERGQGELDVGQYDEPIYIFGPTGAAPLYKRKMLEEIKINREYFDEDLILYYDDLDICWRANLFGWKGFYTPFAIAYHTVGVTNKIKVPCLKFFKRFYMLYLSHWAQANMIRNRYLTMIKNDSVPDFLRYLPNILLYDLKLWAYILLFEPFLIPDLLKNINSVKMFLKKRKIIQERLKSIKDLSSRL